MPQPSDKIAIPGVDVPKVYTIAPYTGPFKECDSIKLTPAGITKPDYCCNNAKPGLLRFAAIYTVTEADGPSFDVCAQCATFYETGTAPQL